MGIKTLLGGAASALALSATFAAADVKPDGDPVSCNVGGDGVNLEYSNGVEVLNNRYSYNEDTCFVGAGEVILPRSDVDNNEQRVVYPEVSQTQVCAIFEDGSFEVVDGDGGEIDLTVLSASLFPGEMLKNASPGAVGSCLFTKDGKMFYADAYPENKIGVLDVPALK